MEGLSDITRGKIIDRLVSGVGYSIFGKLQITDFLKRVWDIDNMPSTDRRFKNATGDIWQHMVNNDDWDIYYLLNTYLQLGDCKLSIFFKFLEEIVNPVVRDEEEQLKLIEDINYHLIRDGYKYQKVDDISGYGVYKIKSIRVGVEGKIKNLIFSADGPKPEIVIRDALTNDIEIVKNQEYCLIYDKPISFNGLTWNQLAEWWEEENKYNIILNESEIKKDLYKRLYKTLNDIEKVFFKYYYSIYYPILREKLPALIPQVYLHYDPYTIKQLNGEKRIERQRMDFLMLLSNKERIVIELDGKQHYSDGDISSPKLYSNMAKMDRKLKLLGYDIYRFGGYEFLKHTMSDEEYNNKITKLTRKFFDKLFVKHNILKGQ